MLGPIESLAFSVHNKPGVYALLLGSGLSRSAMIPTGWEITLDLVTKLAQMKSENCAADPLGWYRNQFEKDPDYSEILLALGKTPEERQQIIREYIEPSEEDRENGLRIPTLAHKAIAQLVKNNSIRVILTTNFDRLMETALEEIGITPTIVSSVDQLKGSPPIVHTQCLLFKIHGDYLDIRIRNTTRELEHYPKEFNKHLKRILEDFGLIICGWSADWDSALSSVIMQSASRRYTHYWAIKGEPKERAKQLILHRQAEKIDISGADQFFPELERIINALAYSNKAHPLSVEAAVNSTKKYLTEPKYRILLDDLVTAEVDEILRFLSDSGFKKTATTNRQPNESALSAIFRAHESALEKLIAMATVGGKWADKWNFHTWQTAIIKLGVNTNNHNDVISIYPATLLFYVYGLALLAGGGNNLPILYSICTAPISVMQFEKRCVSQRLPPTTWGIESEYFQKELEGMRSAITPVSDWIYKRLQKSIGTVFTSESAFQYAFDTFEVYVALNYSLTGLRRDPYWAPYGAYVYRHDNRQQIISTIRQKVVNEGEVSSLVQSGLIGKSVEDCLNNLANFEKWCNSFRSRGW